MIWVGTETSRKVTTLNAVLKVVLGPLITEHVPGRFMLVPGEFFHCYHNSYSWDAAC